MENGEVELNQIPQEAKWLSFAVDEA